jgi:hypothetical protein
MEVLEHYTALCVCRNNAELGKLIMISNENLTLWIGTNLIIMKVFSM